MADNHKITYKKKSNPNQIFSYNYKYKYYYTVAVCLADESCKSFLDKPDPSNKKENNQKANLLHILPVYKALKEIYKEELYKDASNAKEIINIASKNKNHQVIENKIEERFVIIKEDIATIRNFFSHAIHNIAPLKAITNNEDLYNELYKYAYRQCVEAKYKEVDYSKGHKLFALNPKTDKQEITSNGVLFIASLFLTKSEVFKLMNNMKIPLPAKKNSEKYKQNFPLEALYYYALTDSYSLLNNKEEEKDKTIVGLLDIKSFLTKLEEDNKNRKNKNEYFIIESPEYFTKRTITFLQEFLPKEYKFFTYADRRAISLKKHEFQILIKPADQENKASNPKDSNKIEDAESYYIKNNNVYIIQKEQLNNILKANTKESLKTELIKLKYLVISRYYLYLLGGKVLEEPSKNLEGALLKPAFKKAEYNKPKVEESTTARSYNPNVKAIVSNRLKRIQELKNAKEEVPNFVKINHILNYINKNIAEFPLNKEQFYEFREQFIYNYTPETIHEQISRFNKIATDPLSKRLAQFSLEDFNDLYINIRNSECNYYKKLLKTIEKLEEEYKVAKNKYLDFKIIELKLEDKEFNKLKKKLGLVPYPKLEINYKKEDCSSPFIYIDKKQFKKNFNLQLHNADEDFDSRFKFLQTQQKIERNNKTINITDKVAFYETALLYKIGNYYLTKYKKINHSQNKINKFANSLDFTYEENIDTNTSISVQIQISRPQSYSHQIAVKHSQNLIKLIVKENEEIFKEAIKNNNVSELEKLFKIKNEKLSINNQNPIVIDTEKKEIILKDAVFKNMLDFHNKKTKKYVKDLLLIEKELFNQLDSNKKVEYVDKTVLVNLLKELRKEHPDNKLVSFIRNAFFHNDVPISEDSNIITYQEVDKIINSLKRDFKIPEKLFEDKKPSYDNRVKANHKY